MMENEGIDPDELEKMRKAWWQMKLNWRKTGDDTFIRACEYTYIVEAIAKMIIETKKTAEEAYDLFEGVYYRYHDNKCVSTLNTIYHDVCTRKAFLLQMQGKAKLV